MSDATPAVQYPQLRMEIRGLAEHASSSPEPAPPPGYDLRTFRPGDEDAWLALLQSGEFGAWTRTRLDLMLKHPHVRVPPDGIFFATLDDRPVGTASTYLHPTVDGVDPEVGWVVVAPDHRGRGLGLLVCRSVLKFVARLGYRHAYLLTDDFRLPAIRTYLRLGFEPAPVDRGHPARWAAIHNQLRADSVPPLPRAGEGAGGEG
jgi:mycothiol synthase